MKKSLVFSALVLAAAAVSANAQVVVSGQFGLYNILDPTTSAGALPADNYNTFGTSALGDDSDSMTDKTLTGTNLGGEDLVTKGNVATSIGATLSYDAQFETGDGQPTSSGNYALLRASYFTRRLTDTPTPLAAATLTLNGLSATDQYNLFVYVSSPSYGSGSTATITDGIQTFAVTSNNALTSLTQITATNATGNYVEFTGITGLTTATVTIPGANFVGFSGFQLVDTGSGPVGVTVPEPSSVALMGLGLLGLGLIVRRQRAARA